MRRTVSRERRLDPLEIYVDSESVKSKMVDASERLSSEGFGENFIYQAGSIAPPIYCTEDIVERLGGNFAYVTITGFDEDGRRMDEQFQAEHSLGNTAEFERVAEEIDDVVVELDYDLDYWRIGSVSTSAVSGAEIVDELDGMQIQATAEVDAGLEAQRGERGFQPISIGWFYKAPMDKEMQFGYKAFPNREFQKDSEKNYERDEENLAEDLLGRITGQREEERNDHNLSINEIEVLKKIEDGMQRKGLV